MSSTPTEAPSPTVPDDDQGVAVVGAAVGALVFLVCMVLPVVVVGSYAVEPGTGSGRVAGGVTAALGVLFRSTARNMLRSGVGTVVRAASRTASRRAARRFLHNLAAALLRGGGREITGGLSWWAPAAGAVGVAASLGGVLWLSTDAERTMVLGSDPAWLLCALSAVPLLAYFLWMPALARVFGVTSTASTGVDGLVLQAYFTAAGSFLPLTSEVLLEGSPGGKARTAGVSLALFVAGHVVLSWAAAATGSLALSHLATFFLLYGFVFSFPLRPLDGGHLFAVSKVGWFVVWAGLTALFAWRVPEAFHGIL